MTGKKKPYDRNKTLFKWYPNQDTAFYLKKYVHGKGIVPTESNKEKSKALGSSSAFSTVPREVKVNRPTAGHQKMTSIVGQW